MRVHFFDNVEGITTVRPSRAGAAAVGLKTLRTNSAKCEKQRQNNAVRASAVQIPCCEENDSNKKKFSHLMDANRPGRVKSIEKAESFQSSETKDGNINDNAPETIKHSWCILDGIFQSSAVIPVMPSLPNNHTVLSSSSRQISMSNEHLHSQKISNGGTKESYREINESQIKFDEKLAKRSVPFSAASNFTVLFTDKSSASAKSTTPLDSVTSSSTSSTSQRVTSETRSLASGNYGPHTATPSPYEKSVMIELPRIEAGIDSAAEISQFAKTNDRRRDDGEPPILSFKRIRHKGNFYHEN